MLKEQVYHLFQQRNEEEKLVVVKILGQDFWFGGHVHDRVVYEKAFDPIV